MPQTDGDFVGLNRRQRKSIEHDSLVPGKGVVSLVARGEYLEAARDPPRTSAYYRIDVRSEKRFSWGHDHYLSLVLEIVNTTLNREVLRASCSAYACKEQVIGPITIPNLGIEAGF